MKRKKIIFNFLFIVLLIVIPLFVAELLFRFMVFSKSSPFESLKNPSKYAKTSSDDYWKLRYKFGLNKYLPTHPHPLLGWSGFFDMKTLKNWDDNDTDKRRRVVIYGDSYIMCANDSIHCFHEILNSDTAFNKKNILLNYGVGGYGVDQIYLLFSKTIDKFQNPFVIISIMPTDMDRCMLSVRDGQKPYFIEQGDSLKLCGVPIDSVPKHFFEENPPHIASYLWRRIINSKLNPYYDSFPTNNKLREKIMALNKKIILRAYNDIKKRKLDYVFVLFDELWNEEGNWRMDSLKKFFSDNNILYINTSNLVAEDTSYAMYDYANYTIQGDGHPNSHYNKLLCEELKKYVLNYNTYPLTRQNINIVKKENYTVEFYEKKIRRDQNWLKTVTEKAKARSIPLDSMIKMDAIWSYEHEVHKH